MTTTAPIPLASCDPWLLPKSAFGSLALGAAARGWADQCAAPPSLIERTLKMLRSGDPAGVDADDSPVGTTITTQSASGVGSATHDGPSPGVEGSAGAANELVESGRFAAQISMEQLVRDHADAVYRVALSVTRDPMLAEDASQDALIKAWQALPTFRGDAPLRNWVLRIAHNTSISLLRKRRDELRDPAEMPERVAHSSVESHVQDRLAIDRFSLALRELDSVSRSIIVLREVEGLSYDEMCDVLELPMPTIKTRLLRARRQLAIALEGWQP